MTNHVSSVHEKKKPFKCGFCEYSCSLISNMYTHDASVHEKKKPFHCSICDKSFFNKQKMIETAANNPAVNLTTFSLFK